MARATKLDVEGWARKDHFRFFSAMDEPFYGITVEVDCRAAYARCKREGHSFYLYYLHRSLAVANRLEPFKLRIDDAGEPVRYDRVDAGPTVDRPDGTFGFANFVYYEDFADFCAAARKEIDEVRAASGLDLTRSPENNIIHYSTLPWLRFTGLSHARSFSRPDSCPKISFGKLMPAADGKLLMPVSVHVHHGLVDGRDVGEYVRQYEEEMS